MRKFTHLDALDLRRRPKSKAPLVFLCVLILVAAPPLFEVVKLNLGRWGLFGVTNPVDTPILNAVHTYWESGRSEFRDWITPMMVNRRWNPRLVLPIAFFWTAVAAFLLRKGHA